MFLVKRSAGMNLRVSVSNGARTRTGSGSDRVKLLRWPDDSFLLQQAHWIRSRLYLFSMNYSLNIDVTTSRFRTQKRGPQRIFLGRTKKSTWLFLLKYYHNLNLFTSSTNDWEQDGMVHDEPGRRKRPHPTSKAPDSWWNRNKSPSTQYLRNNDSSNITWCWLLGSELSRRIEQV
jgi:hypothetical protein